MYSIMYKNQLDWNIKIGYFYKLEHPCNIRIVLLDVKTPFLLEHMAEINKLTYFYLV